MQLLAPDILADAGELSIGVSATGFTIGLLVWLFGWRGHRFWIVLATTVLAGLLGLYSAPVYKTQPIVAGLLLAVAAGTMALALIRLVAFAAGGVVAWVLVHALAPAWNEPLLCLLVGGLLGLVLFRVWTMALTSLAGTLLMAYSGLCLAHKLGKIDVVALSEKQALLLNAACGVGALLGLIVQYLLGRQRRTDNKAKEARSRSASGPSQSAGGGNWWSRTQRAYRRAG
jgi:hypothetical protein